MGNTRNLGDLLNADSTIATADVADGGITTAKLADDAVTTAKVANDVAISTSGAITTTGAFTSKGIDDDADANVITINSSEAVGIGKSLTLNNYSGYQVLTIGGSDATTGSVIDMENSAGLLIGQLNASSGRLHIGVDSLNANGGSSIRFEVDGGSKFEMGSENLTINDGNLVIGTAGHGIDFSASTDSSNAGSSTNSEILDDYEEGTFSVAEQNGAGVSVSLSQAQYTRIGRMVFFYVDLAIGSNSASGVVNFQSLPFTPSSNKSQKFDTYTNATNNPITFAIGNAIATVKANATANLFYSDLSGKFLRINGQYQLD